MAWFRTGTINVTNGSTAVTGSGTAWITNVGIGEALLAPDGKLYEIANVGSDTSITLGSVYLGSTQTGQAYVIVPSQSYIRDLAAQAATLVNNYSTFYNTVGQGKFADGTLAAPAVSFSSDTNTGFYHSGTDEVTLVANGVAIAKWGTGGFTILNSASVNIDGGTIDGTVIGGTTPAAGSFTQLVATTQAKIGDGTGTSQKFVHFDNAGSNFYIGSEGSVSGGYFANSSAYASVLYSLGTPIEVIVDGVKSSFSSTGLTVTGTLSATGVYSTTTASAANTFVESDGTLKRSTSSLKYKSNVETLDDTHADCIYQMRPVWYRSKCDGDKQNWSWYGLIAEEVAEIDPRLVHWSYPMKTVQDQPATDAIPAVFDSEGNEIQSAIPAREATTKQVKDTDAEILAEGMQYERLTVLLINVVQRQKQTIAAMEARLAALEAA